MIQTLIHHINTNTENSTKNKKSINLTNKKLK